MMKEHYMSTRNSARKLPSNAYDETTAIGRKNIENRRKHSEHIRRALAAGDPINRPSQFSLEGWTPFPSKRIASTAHCLSFAPEIANHQIGVTFGDHTHASTWYCLSCTIGELLGGPLGCFAHGPKDGWTLCQSEFEVNEGTTRKGENASRNWCIMFDSDLGTKMEEAMARVTARGFAAVFWHSPSNGKTESTVPKAKLAEYVGAHPELAAMTLGQQAAHYFLKSKGYHARVFDGIDDPIAVYGVEEAQAQKKHKDGTYETVTRQIPVVKVTHNPLERFRILLFLRQPFEFAGLDFRAQQDKWKWFYTLLARAIGVPYDSSCSDIARHQYLPRMTKVDGFAIEPRIEIVDGALIDVAPFMTSYSPSRAVEARTGKTGKRRISKVHRGRGLFKTPGLRRWIAKYGDGLEIEEFFRHYGLSEFGAGTTGTTFDCPNGDRHSDGGLKVGGFFAENASPREGGFGCACSHDTCKSDCKSFSGRENDRAFFLDLFMFNNGIGVAALDAFCDAGVCVEGDAQ